MQVLTQVGKQALNVVELHDRARTGGLPLRLHRNGLQVHEGQLGHEVLQFGVDEVTSALRPTDNERFTLRAATHTSQYQTTKTMERGQGRRGQARAGV